MCQHVYLNEYARLYVLDELRKGQALSNILYSRTLPEDNYPYVYVPENILPEELIRTSAAAFEDGVRLHGIEGAWECIGDHIVRVMRSQPDSFLIFEAANATRGDKYLENLMSRICYHENEVYCIVDGAYAQLSNVIQAIQDVCSGWTCVGAIVHGVGDFLPELNGDLSDSVLRLIAERTTEIIVGG